MLHAAHLCSIDFHSCDNQTSVLHQSSGDSKNDLFFLIPQKQKMLEHHSILFIPWILNSTTGRRGKGKRSRMITDYSLHCMNGIRSEDGGMNQPVKSKDSTGHEDKTKLMTNNINGITSNIKSCPLTPADAALNDSHVFMAYVKGWL